MPGKKIARKRPGSRCEADLALRTAPGLPPPFLLWLVAYCTFSTPPCRAREQQAKWKTMKTAIEPIHQRYIAKMAVGFPRPFSLLAEQIRSDKGLGSRLTCPLIHFYGLLPRKPAVSLGEGLLPRQQATPQNHAHEYSLIKRYGWRHGVCGTEMNFILSDHPKPYFSYGERFLCTVATRAEKQFNLTKNRHNPKYLTQSVWLQSRGLVKAINYCLQRTASREPVKQSFCQIHLLIVSCWSPVLLFLACLKWNLPLLAFKLSTNAILNNFLLTNFRLFILNTFLQRNFRIFSGDGFAWDVTTRDFRSC